MTKHTPGPWETVFDGAIAAHKEHWRVISSTSGLPIAVMEFGRAGEANAALIAAAPDLLAALERILDDYEGMESACGSIVSQARAALAAARGAEGAA